MRRRYAAAGALVALASSAAAGALPRGYPAAGCDTIADGTGDGRPTALGAVGPVPAAQLEDDPDLDIAGVAIDTTATDLVTYVRVAALGAPAHGGAHEFTVTFTVNDRTVVLRSSGTGSVNGTDSADLAPAVTYDTDSSFVVVGVPLAHLAAATGGPIGPGTRLTNLVVASRWVYAPGQALAADYAQAAATADRVYDVGDRRCFPPRPAALAYTGRTTVQYTDAAAVAARLTDADGAPLAGRPVTFAVASRSVVATTGADGVASARLDPGVVAGTSYRLVTSFAGDGTASAVSLATPFTVTAERTTLRLTVTRSGTRRAVAATLLDDDGHLVRGQSIAWYVDGKRVSAPVTTAGHTVTAVYAGLSGRFLGTTARVKV